jgi:hypothetical protein
MCVGPNTNYFEMPKWPICGQGDAQSAHLDEKWALRASGISNQGAPLVLLESLFLLSALEHNQVSMAAG